MSKSPIFRGYCPSCKFTKVDTYVIAICAVSQSPLERLRTRHNVHSLAVLAITSRLCIAFVYTSSSCWRILDPSMRVWLLGVARAARLWRQCRPREEGWVHAATVRESTDPIEVLYGSCNGESSGLSLLSVACVSHELHARKIRGPRWTNGVRTVNRALLSRALQLDFPRTILR